MLNPAPVPIGATFNAGRTEVVVTFDSEVFAISVSNTNWFARLTNLDKLIPGAVSMAGLTATFPTSAGSADVGTNEIAYDGLNASVRGINGQQIEAFSIEPTLLP